MIKYLRARAKVWSGHGVTAERFSVDASGTVLVYDPIAGHYTACHSMSAGTMDRIRKITASESTAS